MTKKCILKNGPVFVEQGGKWRFLGVMNPRGVSWRAHTNTGQITFRMANGEFCRAADVAAAGWGEGGYTAIKGGARFTQDMVHAYVLDGKRVVAAGHVEPTEVKV